MLVTKTVKTVTNISKLSPSYLVYSFIYTSIKTKVYGVHRCCWRMLVTYVGNGYWWRILETIFYCIQLKSNRIFHFQSSFWISFWTTISPLFRTCDNTTQNMRLQRVPFENQPRETKRQNPREKFVCLKEF